MSDAADLARRLGGQAEAVCRHYLFNGRRQGRYWVAGDVHNASGQSLYVRLKQGAGSAIPGKWTDAATVDHGDLLDLIAAACGLHTLRETLDEARRFLALRPSQTSPRNIDTGSGPPDHLKLRAACSQCLDRSEARSRRSIYAGAASWSCALAPRFGSTPAAGIEATHTIWETAGATAGRR